MEQEPKLKSLYVENFRCLEDVEVKTLGHVNLIVGGNNTGKSTVLEALRIYVDNGGLGILMDISNRRGEPFDLEEDQISDGYDGVLPFEHLFSGRRFPEQDNCPIKMGSSKEAKDILKIEDIFYVQTEEETTNDAGDKTIKKKRQVIPKSAVNTIVEQKVFHALRFSKEDNSVLVPLDSPPRPTSLRFREGLVGGASALFPCVYISSQLESLDRLAYDWDAVMESGKLERVLQVMRYLDPRTENIIAVSLKKNSYRARYSSSRIIKIKTEGDERFFPINSMGEGMRRALQIALQAFSAKSGFLLIDEFENGLHYSVQPKVWEWLFTLSKELDIQVFATTHSKDVIESFKQVAQERKDRDGVLFRMRRSVSTGKIIATVYDEEMLETVLDYTDSDVR
jgi:AAA15 family ATPase/GTPase